MTATRTTTLTVTVMDAATIYEGPESVYVDRFRTFVNGGGIHHRHCQRGGAGRGHALAPSVGRAD